MSIYSPVTVTPLIPPGSTITLPMPESVENTTNTVVFEFIDPMDGSGPVDLEALVAPVLSGSAERIQQDVRRDGLRQVQTDPPATLVSVSWQEVEHYGGTTRNYSAIGALVLAGKRWNKAASEGTQMSLILYRADAIWTNEGVLSL